MLWIALHLPALSLESFAATLGTLQPCPAAGAAAGAAHRGSQPRGAAARRQARLQACHRAGAGAELRFGQADAAREAQALRAVAHAALAFTPMVALDAEPHCPACCSKCGAACATSAACRRCSSSCARPWRRWATACRLASAPTALGAALLARWRSGFELGAHVDDLSALRQRLDDAPVWLLGPGREHRDALQGMGLHTLGDLRRLPRSGLARRFGEALLTELDRARGDVPDPREALRPEPRFEARVELFERADSSEQLLHGALLLLAQLVAWAQAQHARIGGFTLAMRHERRHRGDTDTPEHTELPLARPKPATMCSTCSCCCASGWRGCAARAHAGAAPALRPAAAQRRTQRRALPHRGQRPARPDCG